MSDSGDQAGQKGRAQPYLKSSKPKAEKKAPAKVRPPKEIPLAGDDSAEDGLTLETAAFRSPVLFFIVLAVPIITAMYFTFTAKAPEIKPIVAPAPVVIAKPLTAPVFGSHGSPAKRMMNSEMAPALAPRFEAKGCSFNAAVGQAPSRDLIAAINAAHRPYRLLPPGYPMTMGSDPARVNLELDQQGIIRRVWCG